MYINNKLRDLVYENNLRIGFWDNIRTYKEFIKNLLGEFDETMAELMSGRAPTEVYFKKGNKPEGAPTELADIIIYILDYFGGSEPKIDIDEKFLETPDEYYENMKHYEKTRKKEPWKYFIEIRDACNHYIALSSYSEALHGNEIYKDNDGKLHGVSIELHHVIKLILEFCDIYGIDMEKELIDKINYNSTRPRDYRKMGNPTLLEEDFTKVFNEMLIQGYGMYKETDDIAKQRSSINSKVIGKRKARQQAYIIEVDGTLNSSDLTMFNDDELKELTNNSSLSDIKRKVILEELERRKNINDNHFKYKK